MQVSQGSFALHLGGAGFKEAGYRESTRLQMQTGRGGSGAGGTADGLKRGQESNIVV